MARCELLDPAAIRAVNAHDELAEPEALHAVPRVPRRAAGGRRAGGVRARDRRRPRRRRVQLDDDHRRAQQLWRARHNAYFAVVAHADGDARADHRRLRAGLARWPRASPPAPRTPPGCRSRPRWSATSPTATTTGSAPSTPSSEAEQAALAGFVERMVTRAQEAGGTCTGEHGVGIGKREALLAQSGEAAVETMRALKRGAGPGRDPQPRQGAAGLTFARRPASRREVRSGPWMASTLAAVRRRTEQGPSSTSPGGALAPAGPVLRAVFGITAAQASRARNAAAGAGSTRRERAARRRRDERTAVATAGEDTRTGGAARRPRPRSTWSRTPAAPPATTRRPASSRPAR